MIHGHSSHSSQYSSLSETHSHFAQTTGKFQVSFDLFHCDTTFLTLPADKVATVDCTRADGANSWTPFCFSQKEPGHIPGYISVC
jgi:hypothetical protein